MINIEICPFCQSPLQEAPFAFNNRNKECPTYLTDPWLHRRSHFARYNHLNDDNTLNFQVFQSYTPNFLITLFNDTHTMLVYTKGISLSYKEIIRNDNTSYQDFLNMYFRLQKLNAFS
jgi:hypothetical protein